MRPSLFGKILHRERLATGKSLRAFGRAIGVSHVYVRKVENGTRRSMSEALWPALAEVTGVDAEKWGTLAELSRPLDAMAHPSEEVGRLIETVAVLAADGDITAEDVDAVRDFFGLEPS